MLNFLRRVVAPLTAPHKAKAAARLFVICASVLAARAKSVTRPTLGSREECHPFDIGAKADVASGRRTMADIVVG